MSDFPENENYTVTAGAARDRLRAAGDRLVELLQSGGWDLEAAREMTLLREELREAGDLLVAVLMRARARITMDAHIIGQVPFAKLGEELGVSTNAPNMWRGEVGPRFYVLIFSLGKGEYLLQKEPTVRRAIARRTRGGAVIIPSRLRLDLLSDEQLAKLPLEELYEAYKGQASYGAGEDHWVS